MDTIEFTIRSYENDAGWEPLLTIDIYINERNLIDMVGKVEGRVGDIRDGNPLEQSYFGIPLHNQHEIAFEFLGLKDRPYSIVLVCTCLEALCNCIMVKVAMDEGTVTWSEFKSPLLGGPTPSWWVSEEEAAEAGWKPIDYSTLGPFVFDRKQYISALRKLVANFSSLT